MIGAPFRLRAMALAIGCALNASAFSAHADESAPSQTKLLAQMFDPALIRGDGNVDLGNLLSAQGGALPPGTYRFDVVVNGDAVGKQDVLISSVEGQTKPSACLTAEMLERFGVRKKAIEELVQRSPANCLDLRLLDSNASVDYDSGSMYLTVSIPQAYMVAGRRGYVDPSLWDYGVNAGFLNYQASTRSDRSYGRTSRSSYVGLTNGLNLWGWRLRNESNITHSEYMGTEFKSNRTFIQHDLTRMRSQLSMGELYSGSDIFNSVRFRGIQIASDEGMLADNERGFNPVIRGTADTNATVEVRQNGYLLSSVQVSPGPFALSDIFPNGSNGDLEVTVIEADGRRRSFRQAYATLPLLTRKGRLRYSAEVGQYRATDGALPTPTFGSFSGIYGLTDNVSIAGGVQASSDYQAVNVGVGSNTPIGAMSVDVTHSRSNVAGRTDQGQSIRALYSKTLSETSTTFTLAAYRYSTEGYRTFDNHIYEKYESRDSRDSWRTGYRSRSRLDLTVNQQLGDGGRYGSFYLNGTHENYWNNRKSSSINAGYGNNWGRMFYNITYGRTKERSGYSGAETDNRVMLSLTIPFGSGRDSPTMYLNSTRTDSGTAATANLSGYVPGTDYTSYSLQASRGEDNDKSGAIGLSSDFPVARVGASYSAGRDYHSYNLNASGAVVAHAGGVNFSRDLGDSFALVEVEGVKGVGVGGNLPTTGLNAYTVYPNTQPYRLNTVRLDSQTLGADTELETLTQTVVPRRGAIVATSFKGYSGRRVQMSFNWTGGKLPIGAAVEDSEGRQVGLVDNNGQALLLVREDQGSLAVKWEAGTCQVTYSLPERDPSRYYDTLSTSCR
ncbi:fimbria/pilus outer membrane usher protein [Pseudomonas aeruginosa]